MDEKKVSLRLLKRYVIQTLNVNLENPFIENLLCHLFLHQVKKSAMQVKKATVQIRKAALQVRELSIQAGKATLHVRTASVQVQKSTVIV